jgi:hypothetical protein
METKGVTYFSNLQSIVSSTAPLNGYLAKAILALF